MNKIETNVIKPEISFFENETENLVITPQYENALDSRINDVKEYMVKNTSGDPDMLYKESQAIWGELANTLRETKYNFHLNRNQWKFLTNLILSKLEYDVNTVFFAIELTQLLGSMEGAKYSNDTELIAFPVNATEITYIYHLISNYKVKGLTKDSYLFAEVLRRIGDISKVFNYYDTTAKNLSNDILDWIATFGDSDEVVEETKSESTEA